MDSEVRKLYSQADSLAARFAQGEGIGCIDEAINLDREALKLCPLGHCDRAASLSQLAFHLRKRYGQLGAVVDVEEAIKLDREALDLRPRGHPDRPTSSNNLAVGLSARYDRLGAMRDLEEAIVLGRETLDLYPQGHPDLSMSLNNLAVDLCTRYRELGRLEDLDEAIALDQEALDLRPQGHPQRSMSLNSLAVDLAIRYEQLGVMTNLDRAIVFVREALDLCPRGHPDRQMSLCNLSGHLTNRYQQLGMVQDLDEAIALDREALNLLPPGHPDEPMSLNNLAVDLRARYEQLDAMQDIDEAIALARKALALCSQGHPDRSLSLHNLAVHLFIRYQRLATMKDLDEAIAFGREAVKLCAQGNPLRPGFLNNLASSLSSQHRQLGRKEYLDEAILLQREALDLHPQGHPKRPASLNNLAVHLSSRYKQLGSMQDLDEAIILEQEAVDLCPHGHPNRSASLYGLAQFLRDRYTQLERSKDSEELFNVYNQLVHVNEFVSSTDLSAAREWIRVAEDFKHPTLLVAYETSLRLLVQHLAALPSLPQHLGILRNLTSSLAVDAFSACLHNRALGQAVELLEQGRGVFWGRLTRLSSPLEDLIGSGSAGKALANEFTQLASLIRNALNSSSAEQHERVCHLNVELQRVVNDIRELPGLSRFLLPSLFSDLRHAASCGPVIIVNASKRSCDALIVLANLDPVHIPLQITRDCVRDLSTELHFVTVRATRGSVARELASFLRKLWDQIVSTIVDALQMIHPLQSRIWWCPTAEFSVLPLHAAGPFRKGKPNLPDLYISSYTPTLTALIRARRHGPSTLENDQKHFVAIGQAKAAGESELHSVDTELVNIGESVDGLATFTAIDGKESSISRVIEEFGKNEWVHLACHGLPNRTQPFESAFALRDGHFTVQQIIGCHLKNPEFAYLSACHTTVGDEESPDEVIHLASAMQFAGFRSVIGTMWAVDDVATSKITSTFYGHMVDESGRLDHTRAAFALNKTMKSVHIPFDQKVLYIHLGA